MAAVEATAGVAAQTAQAASVAAQVAATAMTPMAHATSMNLAGVQQVPMAPIYKGATRRERRMFMDSYLSYVRRLTVLNQGTGKELLLMPLAACVDPAIVSRICVFDLRKPVAEVTEDDWRAYFQSACGTLRINMSVVMSSMKNLAMNTRFADAESRVGQLLADFQAKSEEIDMTDLMEREPKAYVKILMAAVRPMGLKNLLEEELHKEDHSVLKKDVVEFTVWLRQHVELYMPYERLNGRSEALTEAKAEVPRKDWKTKRNDGAKVAVINKGDDKNKSVKPMASSNGSRCLKCGDTNHRVSKCS